MKLYTSNVGSMSDEEILRLMTEIGESGVLSYSDDCEIDSWEEQARARYFEMDEERARRRGWQPTRGAAFAELDAYVREYIEPKAADIFSSNPLIDRIMRGSS